MSMSDPIADTLTRIRNAQSARHENVVLRWSKIVESILNILKEEGFIGSVELYSEGSQKLAKVELKYYRGEPVIRGLERISKPGRRIYISWKDIKPTMNNMGLSILSTPKGVVSDKMAKYMHVGGEFLCKVW